MEAFYNSLYQQPFLLGVPTLVFIAYLLVRREPRDWVWRYCVNFAFLSVLDAWLTANVVVGYGPLSGTAATVIPIFFVVLGDFRVFAWIFRGRWFLAGALSLVVPIASSLLLKIGPSRWAENPRLTYLSYEVLFVFFFGAVCLVRRRLDRASAYALAYYSVWIFADLLLLNEDAVGFAWGLRIFANLMYYDGWTPWIMYSKEYSFVRSFLDPDATAN